MGVHALADSTAVLFPKSEQAECGAAEGSSVPWAATSQGGRGKTRGKRDAWPFGQTVHPHLFHPEHNKKHARGPALTCCSRAQARPALGVGGNAAAQLASLLLCSFDHWGRGYTPTAVGDFFCLACAAF